ncbi:cupin domain-containing protein [Sphingomonas sp.]|uniref:cupin domain-containing protein n=1 Tax=Sphingomonas sp. TaxID=28214 RepID=UPI002DD664E1|nr:cupin domain-containing protein [Sphingomonas sp.]
MPELATMSDAQQRRALIDELAAFNTRVGQPDDPPLFTREPVSEMVPVHWRAADLARLLDRIGSDLKLEAGGIRRTLRLTNPGLGYGTTPSLFASIQVILPGEVATAHRHTASALRFIMRGSGANTIVDGEQYDMSEGDLVLTPSMTWHDHEHLGDAPMIWLDVLDISLVRRLEAVFFEGSDVPRRAVSAHPTWSYGSYGGGWMQPRRRLVEGRADAGLLAYPRAQAEASLRAAAERLPADPADDVVMDYVNPATGGPALPTVGTTLQMIRAGVSCRAQRHTGSSVFYVVRGAGLTTVGDQRFDWGTGDLFAVPAWSTHRHENPHAEDALLFQVSDVPALKALGLYFEEII